MIASLDVAPERDSLHIGFRTTRMPGVAVPEAIPVHADKVVR